MTKEKQISINIIRLATKNISNIPKYQTVGSSGIDLSASPDISDKGMIIKPGCSSSNIRKNYRTLSII